MTSVAAQRHSLLNGQAARRWRGGVGGRGSVGRGRCGDGEIGFVDNLQFGADIRFEIITQHIEIMIEFIVCRILDDKRQGVSLLPSRPIDDLLNDG